MNSNWHMPWARVLIYSFPVFFTLHSWKGERKWSRLILWASSDCLLLWALAWHQRSPCVIFLNLRAGKTALQQDPLWPECSSLFSVGHSLKSEYDLWCGWADLTAGLPLCHLRNGVSARDSGRLVVWLWGQWRGSCPFAWLKPRWSFTLWVSWSLLLVGEI